MREVGFLYPLSQDRCTVPWWPFKWASPSRRGQLFRNSLEPTLKSQSIHCGLEAMPGWVGNVSSLIFLHCNCYSLDFVLSLKQLVSQRHWNQPDSTSHLSSDLWTLLRINRSLVSVTFMYERLLVFDRISDPCCSAQKKVMTVSCKDKGSRQFTEMRLSFCARPFWFWTNTKKWNLTTNVFLLFW